MRSHVPAQVQRYLDSDDRAYLSEIFHRFDGYPSLEDMWTLMDEQWISHKCDPDNFDERIDRFYEHPVWLLNGIFIEQHRESMAYRREFASWVLNERPARIADYGGGFGGLARLIGMASKSIQVEVVEPHPHAAGIALVEEYPNVRYVPELDGEYDLLIATDVFEHVPDPIALVENTAKHLKNRGKYLIANCFEPVIFCHLPQNFYLHFSWETILEKMGLKGRERVAYGRVFEKYGDIDVDAASKAIEKARFLHNWLKYLPRGRGKVGGMLMRLLP